MLFVRFPISIVLAYATRSTSNYRHMNGTLFRKLNCISYATDEYTIHIVLGFDVSAVSQPAPVASPRGELEA